MLCFLRLTGSTALELLRGLAEESVKSITCRLCIIELKIGLVGGRTFPLVLGLLGLGKENFGLIVNGT